VSAYEAYRGLVEGNGDVGGTPLILPVLVVAVIVGLIGLVMRVIADKRRPKA
jgi:hypothetical protein